MKRPKHDPVRRLREVVKRPELKKLGGSIRARLQEEDAELKALIAYWSTGKRPARLPDGEVLFGAIPFLCAHPEKSPVPLPKLLQEALEALVFLGVVPEPTITVADWSALLRAIDQDRAVAPDGSIYGKAPYEQLDPWWLASLLNCLTTIVWGKFGNSPCVATIADSVTVGLVGDWGTGFVAKYQGRNPAQRVIESLIGMQPDLLVHLGDTYYSGTPNIADFLPPGEERAKLLACWPKRRKAGTSFTLNSNHEMYSLGRGYLEALESSAFRHQNATSTFLLQNKSWQIFGLDSAYGAERTDLFMEGALDAAQIRWMQRVRDPARRCLVLTHHNPLSLDGSTCNALWSQVEKGLSGKQPDYWYWGHIHNGIVYKGVGRAPAARNAVQARCVGHSAIPFGFAWGLAKPQTLQAKRAGSAPTAFQPLDTIDYFAHELVGNGPYVKNGFALLRLSGAGISEQFYDENGTLTWRGLD